MFLSMIISRVVMFGMSLECRSFVEYHDGQKKLAKSMCSYTTFKYAWNVPFKILRNR